MIRVFLIGFMGSGKTTIGRIVANRLGYKFIDLDTVIEKKYFKSVSAIFAQMGETEFRKIERNCLHEVAEFEHTIISTGGGTPCFFDNMDYMKSLGNTIYLKFTAKELARRLESAAVNKRPLIQNKKGEELEQYIDDMLKIREAFYLQSSFTISGDIETIATEICKLMSGAD